MSIDHPIPEIHLFQSLTFKIQGQVDGRGHSSKWLPIDSRPICSMLIGHTTPWIQFFKIWTWKSKVKVIAQGHIVGSTSYLSNPKLRSWMRSKFSHKVVLTSYWFTPLSFHVDRSSHSWDMAFSKFDLENPRSRSHSGSSFLSTHISCVLCLSTLPIWPWKIKVKVMGEVKVQSHEMCPASCWFTSLSFSVNWPSFCNTAFSTFDLEKPMSRS